MNIKVRLCILFISLGWFFGFSQLSDLHYLPPLKQRVNQNAVNQQAIYLSTPVITPFTVNVFRGTSAVPLTSFLLSNGSPFTYNLPNGDNEMSFVSNTNTGVVLTNSGLRFESVTGDRFYVNHRGRSFSQAVSLTSKGREALGTNFRWGGAPVRGGDTTMNASLGIMGTENGTNITISNYNPDCEFRLQNDPDGITADIINITLQAGESYVLEAILDETTANIDGWLGASIVSNNDIVISNGLLTFGVQPNNGSRDAGIDQPVPLERLGDEYVFVRGNGLDINEIPIIIAVEDNTNIFVNGSTIPIATIDDGEYFEIPATNYSGTSAGANLHVLTSNDVYAYQVLSGDERIQTIGLNFIAPLDCLLPRIVDNIPDIRAVADITINGSVTIIASTSAPDASISVTDGSGNITLPPSSPVAGTTAWKTFFVPNLTGNVIVQSTGSIAVGFFGFSENRGIAGYFSGFDTAPDLNLQITGRGCFPSGAIEIIETEIFDAYQWFKDGIAIVGETAENLIPDGPGTYYVEVTRGLCIFDSNEIPLGVCTVITNRKITFRVNPN